MSISADLLFLIVLLPFIAGGLALFLPQRARNAAAALSGGTALLLLAATLLYYPAVSGGKVVRHEVSWLPQFGFELTWRLDGVSWLFALLITGIGALVVLYARYYMSAEDPVPRFFSFLLGFMGAMLGIVLSGNLIQLVFFWEVTSLLSFLLIGYWYHNANARGGAQMALIVTGFGGLCLLAGALLIGHAVGSYDVDVLLASVGALTSSRLFTPALALVLIGAFAKSAQFPLHFWLPHAMAAPTPVSAYLHSATMVKAGVYLLIRLWPVMGGTTPWYYSVSIVGLLTFMLGGLFATAQSDLKGILAYSTISHLGLITLLLGLSTPAALGAALFHVFNHATFKASLFMAAGIVDHETGTRDVRRLSGLIRFMPVTGALAIIAAGAMAGVPLLNGFISKEMFLTETLAFHTGSWFDASLPVFATIGSAFSVLYSVRFIHQVFFGPPPTALPREPHEPVAWMRRPIEVLVAVCLVVGVIPGIVVSPFLNTAVAALLGANAPRFDLALWHGFTPALLLSTIALIGGVLAYAFISRPLENRDYSVAPWAGRVRARRLFELSLTGLSVLSRRVTRLLTSGRLQPQLLLILLAALVAGLAPFALTRALGGSAAPLLGGEPFTPLDLRFALIWALGAAFAVGAAIFTKLHRLSALIFASGAGVVVCLTFVWLSAPDLAVTQLVVEILTTVLLLLGLRWLPRARRERPTDPGALRRRSRRARDLTVAVAAGGGLALLSLAAMSRPAVNGIADYFLANSLPGGGGRNVVNVILVDFRGFDTLGEITVLGVVGLTIFALLRRFRPAREVIGRPRQQRRQLEYDEAHAEREAGDTATDFMHVPRVVMHLLFPFIIMFAAFIFLRGHDQPGGGFAAGVAMSIAFILQYMAGGTRWVEERLRVLPLRWIGAGLLLAGLTGAGAWLFGAPFLTSGQLTLTLPLFGEVTLASASLFDLGVFLLVVGATVLMLIALAHQSIRRPREIPAQRQRPADGVYTVIATTEAQPQEPGGD